MKYRPEIDGLRAIAVIAVIVFHLDKSWLPGGFLGVDIFFTISGYLIASIILQEIASNEFSIWKFWQRRARRLLPALILVVGCVLFAGGFLMIRPERTGLPMQGLASLFSFANVYFWQTTGGYWSAPAQSLPLLHTWTLSLEEQFYLVLPALVILLSRFNSRRQITTVCILLATSLLLCLLATPSYRSASFFLLPTRMWELLLGVTFAYWHFARPSHRKLSRAPGWLPDFGLGLIILSLSLIPNNEAFPGWRPLVPCIGVVFLLHSRNTGSSPTLALLTLPPVVLMGKLSYSLYLWHWPVFVFLPYVGITSVLAKLTWTVSLAALSYFLVEKPLRYGSRRSFVGWITIISLTTLSFIFVCVIEKSPLLSSLGNLDTPRSLTRGHEFEASAMLQDQADSDEIKKDLKRPLICLAGSSHARVLGKPIEVFADESGFGFISLATSNLGLTSQSNPEVPDAELISEARMRLIRELKPEVVIIGGMWSQESKRYNFNFALTQVLRAIADAGEQVIVVGQVPMIQVPDVYDGDLRKYLIAGRLSGREVNATPDPAVFTANQTVRQAVQNIDRPNVTFIDPTSTLIVEGMVKLTDEEHFLYSDYHHVNDDGAQIVFDGAIRTLLTNTATTPLLNVPTIPK